jgi:phenylacetate-CoA ligase
LPDGAPGELVFTSLTKEALPVIRYRTRDLATLLPPTSRSMRRMGKITGRSDDMLIIRGVNVFPSQIEELVLQQPRLGPHYQLVLTRDGHRDQLEVNVELRREFSGLLDEDDCRAIADDLQHQIKSFIGLSATVYVQLADSLPRTQTGKAIRVVDKRHAYAEPATAGARGLTAG